MTALARATATLRGISWLAVANSPGMRATIAEQAAMETAELRIRAVCPAAHLEAVTDLVTARAALIMREQRLTGHWYRRAVTEAMDSVYADLAAGWLPEERP